MGVQDLELQSGEELHMPNTFLVMLNGAYTRKAQKATGIFMKKEDELSILGQIYLYVLISIMMIGLNNTYK